MILYYIYIFFLYYYFLYLYVQYFNDISVQYTELQRMLNRPLLSFKHNLTSGVVLQCWHSISDVKFMMWHSQAQYWRTQPHWTKDQATSVGQTVSCQPCWQWNVEIFHAFAYWSQSVTQTTSHCYTAKVCSCRKACAGWKHHAIQQEEKSVKKKTI